MTDQQTELSTEELEEQSGEQLPDREAMSLVDMSGDVTTMPVIDDPGSGDGTSDNSSPPGKQIDNTL